MRWKTWIRGAVAAIAGYAVIVALTTLGFNVWLEGENLYRGGPGLQVRGALVAVVAGLAGGAVAAWVGRRRPLLHAALVLVLVTADSAYVLFVLPLQAPWWFEAAGSLTLAAATLAGGFLQLQLGAGARAAAVARGRRS
jgi:hypothetical protein